jgi:hypothetical protein
LFYTSDYTGKSISIFFLENYKLAKVKGRPASYTASQPFETGGSPHQSDCVDFYLFEPFPEHFLDFAQNTTPT